MSVRIALAQINPTVGDLVGNLRLIQESLAEAERAGADLVAVPELAITGYPPEDLVLRSSFLEDNMSALSRLADGTSDLPLVVGFVESSEEGVFNSAALLHEREIKGVYRKHLLPNYGVFDERRYFLPGVGLMMARIRGVLVGITICEDLWGDDGPHAACAAAGAQVIVNINASPYHRAKGAERLELLQRRARENRVGFGYVNTVGGQDELVFDGQSLAVNERGDLVARAAQFKEQQLLFEFEPSQPGTEDTSRTSEPVTVIEISSKAEDRSRVVPLIEAEAEPTEEVFQALVLAVRDYLRKNGQSEAVVGMSGGIDSALTAVIAAEALGADNVIGVAMASEYTSDLSVRLAEQLAQRLGMRLFALPIADSYESVMKALDPIFSGTEPGIAEENIQSRLRGLMLMAISNKRPGCIVLSTGNKSEMATGYATLYGDMAGGFAVLKDVPKTLVYELARWVNREEEVIPKGIIDRPPSAELRPDQKDTDSLPLYEVLDPILEAYVEDDKSVGEIVAMGYDSDIVKRVALMVDLSEYKRRQAPPGPKVTDRAFSKDRRLPITNRYRPYR